MYTKHLIKPLQINCAGRQVASPSVASLTSPCYSGSACANEDREKLTIGTVNVLICMHHDYLKH